MTDKDNNQGNAEIKPADAGKGLICPGCGCVQSKITTNRRLINAIRRYRECEECGHIQRTTEKPDNR